MCLAGQDAWCQESAQPRTWSSDASRAMATHALSESRPSCLRPRQRILCLHSFRTSGAILKQQLFLFSNLGKSIRVAM